MLMKQLHVFSFKHFALFSYFRSNSICENKGRTGNHFANLGTKLGLENIRIEFEANIRIFFSRAEPDLNRSLPTENGANFNILKQKC